jgi:hypothetical protein
VYDSKFDPRIVVDSSILSTIVVSTITVTPSPLERISRTHCSNASLEPTARTHRSNPPLEPIARTHRSNPVPITVDLGRTLVVA